MNAMSLVEKNLVPDFLIRRGIRKLLKDRLREKNKGSIEAQSEALQAFVKELGQSPIAVETAAANEQHYEVPTEFYKLCLGKNLKYSGGYWPAGVKTLDASEKLPSEVWVMPRLRCAPGISGKATSLRRLLMAGLK